MNHDPEFQARLEKLIDDELKQLPPVQAPEALLQRVLSAIDEEQNRPWWQKPWSCWPRAVQMFFMASLVGLAGALVYGLSLAPTGAPAEWASAKLTSAYAGFDTFFSVCSTLVNALLLLIQTTFSSWILVALGVASILYAASVALGIAWFRVAVSQRAFTFKSL
jgi:hypothetical protein